MQELGASIYNKLCTSRTIRRLEILPELVAHGADPNHIRPGLSIPAEVDQSQRWQLRLQCRGGSCQELVYG